MVRFENLPINEPFIIYQEGESEKRSWLRLFQIGWRGGRGVKLFIKKFRGSEVWGTLVRSPLRNGLLVWFIAQGGYYAKLLC